MLLGTLHLNIHVSHGDKPNIAYILLEFINFVGDLAWTIYLIIK